MFQILRNDLDMRDHGFPPPKRPLLCSDNLVNIIFSLQKDLSFYSDMKENMWLSAYQEHDLTDVKMLWTNIEGFV